MKTCFFTMADSKKLPWARNLIFSGVRCNRPIWFFRIPQGAEKKRYKIELLRGDLLPDAEKYVYLDADCLMLARGNWEDKSVFGARVEKPRSHNLSFKSHEARNQFCKLLNEETKPESNTGCVVLPAETRKQIGERWHYWCQYVDTLLDKPSGTRDQFHFRFVRKEFDIPDLPEQYCALATVEDIRPGSVLAHFTAIGRSYPKYKACYNGLLGKELQEEAFNESMKSRWKSIVDLVLKYAENPTKPVGAEIGVHKGETTNLLMKALPGLKLYCIDPWQDIPEQRKPWEAYYGQFLQVKEIYKDRIIEQKTYSLKAQVDEPLDFVFIDADHSSLAVENDIRFWSKKVKPGGVVIGHDIGFKGTYYDSNSVRRGVEAVYKTDYHLAPGFVWWKQKR